MLVRCITLWMCMFPENRPIRTINIANAKSIDKHSEKSIKYIHLCDVFHIFVLYWNIVSDRNDGVGGILFGLHFSTLTCPYPLDLCAWAAA